ncbi:MAG: nucleoside phosphorylase [Sedimentibacter sp.]|uniref:nucleoside phosphorylase n=1 Tax=Sedimentibacter sp. TaxID=1960295 RepID=UPI0031581731
MSILDSFDNDSEEILKPSHVTERIEDFPEVVVATFSDRVMNLVKNMDGAVQISHMAAGYTIPIYKVNYMGNDVAVYQTILGGAGSAGLLEEVIAKGGRKFVFFGSCGTLDLGIAAGHFIIPVAAYRDEGTSYHYAPSGDFIEVLTADKLAGIFQQLDIPYIKTKTWTTDALYRETRKNMMKRKSEGCLAVDMECASIMAVSQFRNVELYQFLYAEDTLDGMEWDSRTMGKVSSSTFENYLKTALQVAIRV